MALVLALQKMIVWYGKRQAPYQDGACLFVVIVLLHRRSLNGSQNRHSCLQQKLLQ